MSLAILPRQLVVDQNGAPRIGAELYFYRSGTTTPIKVYTTSAKNIEQENPIESMGDGLFPAIYVDESVNPTHKQVLKDADGVTIWTEDNIPSSPIVYPQTAAEAATGVEITNYARTSSPIDVMRFGIIPNNAALATANTERLRALVDPTVTGPQGTLVFPPIIGGDIYHFDGTLQFRDNIRMNLMGCRLKLTKTLAGSDDRMAFVNAIRDFTIENGTIEVEVTSGTGGSNALACMRLGSRYGYPFASYIEGIFDKDDLADNGIAPMGNISVRNVHFKTNNPFSNCAAITFGIGGLDNVAFDNVTFEGSGASGANCGFYYEFGFASKRGFPSTTAQWSSSHATNMSFRNISGKNLDLNPTDGYVVSLVEAASFSVDGIKGEGVYGVFESRIGETHFYRPWSASDTAGPRIGSVKNVQAVGAITGVGLALNGAQGTSTGMYSDSAMTAAGLTPLTASQKVDLMQYVVDGVDLDMAASGVGISLSAPVSIRRGAIRGASNGINVLGECVDFDISGVYILDSAGVGFRCNTTSSIFNRRYRGRLTNMKICGSAAAAAISVDNSESVYVGFNQLGYSTSFDNANEATQLQAVSVSSGARGVLCEGNFGATSGGVEAYALAGSGDRGCNVVSARGLRTFSGPWLRDGIALASAAQIADIADIINTQDKYTYKEVTDNSNNRKLFALGAAAGDGWRLVDGSGTVTPS